MDPQLLLLPDEHDLSVVLCVGEIGLNLLHLKPSPPPVFTSSPAQLFPCVVPTGAAGMDDASRNGPASGSGRGTEEGDAKPSKPPGQPGPKLRGEDWSFELYGLMQHEKLHFHMIMTPETSTTDTAPVQPIKHRTVAFDFDPEVDTVDNIAAELSQEFHLSPTDLEICAAALREWMAQRAPGSEKQ